MRFVCASACLLPTLLPVLLVTAVRADTVRLRNGNTIEGIVTQETATQIVLALGTGSTTLSRSAVAAVEHASAEANDRLQAGWKQKYFLHREYVPPELAALAAEFAKLDALRAEASRANRTLFELSARDVQLTADLEQIRAQLVQTSQRIQEWPAALRTEGYNVLIVSNNALQARWTTTNSEQTGCRKERGTAEECVSVYLGALASFDALFAAEQKKQPAQEASDTSRQQFLNRLTQALAEYARDFSAVAVPASSSHAGMIVTARINDLVSGRFLVDTGATRVTVTESFAQRLQLDVATLPEAEFTMADGRKTKGHTVMFHTMSVGDARAEDIAAAVLPGEIGEPVDGLLGMSFLRRFAVDLDGNSGKLILRQFVPKQ